MRISCVVYLWLGLLLPTGSAEAQSARQPQTQWTLPQVRQWAWANQAYSTWHGWLLYQGSDTAAHHFIGRVNDEWAWFAVRRAELPLADERPYRRHSSAPLGYYYVDATHDFVRTKDYPTR